MMKINFARLASVSFAAIILFSGCRKRADVAMPDNLIVFTSTEQGITESENSIEVKMKLSRGTDKDVPVTINFTPAGLVYGTDFTTTPAAINGELTVIVPSGNNEAKFTVNKVPGALYDGDEKITFDIYRSESPVMIGAIKEFALGFKELVANNAISKFDGGGTTFPNKVFFDLSANRQTAVARNTWDLGFYTDPADFKVIVNSSAAMLAKQISKNDLAQVTAADTVGFYLEVAYSSFAVNPAAMNYFDHPTGDLTKTAFKEIATNDADNKVFIINRGVNPGSPTTARGWKKVRVLRNGSGGYTVQYADIAATTFNTINVPKDNAFFFNYISFDNGLQTVEPKKTKWDIAWTYFANTTGTGINEAPFMFQDFVIQNRNVQVARWTTAQKPYENFTEADLASIQAADWSSAQNKIGPDWRQTFPSLAVYTDRYYIIKDGENNIYKLKFTSALDAGVRGYPSVAYELIKRG
jgi:hypothetical protein